MKWQRVRLYSASTVLLLLSVLAVSTPGPLLASGCAGASVADMARLLGVGLDGNVVAQIAVLQVADAASMLAVRDAARILDVALVGVAVGLQDLVTQVPGPKIIHLNDPAHFLVMARASDEWVRFLDGGRVLIVPREEIEKRYSGHALILDQSQFADGGPRLEVTEFHHTFGIAGVGQEVEHAFTVRNVGNEDLLIHPEGKTCCGAPKVTIEREDLAPGESTQVTVSFTIGYSGSVMKSAELLTTDPTQPVVFLTVHGQVPHDLRVNPDRIHLSGEKGAIPARTVTISGPAEIDLNGIETEHGLFDLTLSEPQVSEDEKKTWTLELGFKPESFVGEIEDQLSIKTTHPERPLVTIPITGRIRGDLRLTPPSVFLGFVDPGAEAQQTIAIESRSFAPFVVRSLAADSPRITAGECVSILPYECKPWLRRLTHLFPSFCSLERAHRSPYELLCFSPTAHSQACR